MHMYFDTSNLNAPYDGSALGLGAARTAQDLPWKIKSAQTEELQLAVNRVLESNGYCRVAANGVLGPRTCGANELARSLLAEQTEPLPDACYEHESEWIVPSRSPCPAFPPRDEPRGYGRWFLIGGVVLAGALSIAFYMGRRTRR
jgi:hypothetical protein